MRVAVPNMCPSLAGPLDHLFVVPWHGGFLDPALGLVLLTGHALCIDPEQDIYTVAGPLGDLRRGHASVQPSGHRSMAKVVGPPGEQRRGLGGGEATARALWKIRR